MRQVTVAIAGLGSRGKDTYAPCAKRFPEKMKITAIADPIAEKRDMVMEEYGVPKEMCFETAEEMLQHDRLADILFVCTQDGSHYAETMQALDKGYHVLLEKPVSKHIDECANIAKKAKEVNRQVRVCHVLRYTPFYQVIKREIDAGRIGRVMSIQAIENVGYWHQAHSFVRGNWRNSDETSPMILAKSCHDCDILLWLAGKKCNYVSSFGSLSEFRSECAPKGAAKRCMDGCAVKESCPFDAQKIYLSDEATGVLHGHTGWPANILTEHPDEESVREAIKSGPYGRCVYYCDNNVVDHQVLNAELEDGVTLNFTMAAFTSHGGRNIKVMGTRGDIIGDMDRNTVVIQVFGQEDVEIDVTKYAADFSGHGGGDHRMVEEFLDSVGAGETHPDGLTSIGHSVESHYLAMAAEYSRIHHGMSVPLASVRQAAENKPDVPSKQVS